MFLVCDKVGSSESNLLLECATWARHKLEKSRSVGVDNSHKQTVLGG